MKVNRQTEAQSFSTPNAVVTPLATARTGSEQVSVIRQRMENGHSNPNHTQTTEEVMVMLEGSVSVSVAGEESRLTQGDTLIVPANTVHSISNISGDPAEWLIISPAGMQFHGPDGNPMSPDWAK
jgi:quercetin dioxygenase-like cupin family protein